MKYAFRLISFCTLYATCLGCGDLLGDLHFESPCENQGLDCDDGNPCTLDRCVYYIDFFGTGKSGPQCEPEPTNDGSACTFAGLLGTCQGGLCGAAELCDGVVCEDDDKCTDDKCAWNGECAFTPVLCDDDDQCTQDRCDPATGMCDFATPTEDGSWCLVEATSTLVVGGCEAGVCVGPCDPESDVVSTCPVEVPLGSLLCCPGNESCTAECSADP